MLYLHRDGSIFCLHDGFHTVLCKFILIFQGGTKHTAKAKKLVESGFSNHEVYRLHFDSQLLQKIMNAAWLPCRETFSLIDAFCSGVNLAYFPLGLLLPCDAFLSFIGIFNCCRANVCKQGSTVIWNGARARRLELPVQHHRSIDIATTWEIAHIQKLT